MKRFVAGFVFVLASAAATRAQVAVYAMGSAGHLSTDSTFAVPAGSGGSAAATTGFWAYGGTLGLYDNFLRLGPVKLGGDVRGFLQTKSNNLASNNANQLRGGLVGLRLAGSAPLVPFKPYIQAEIGGGSTNYASTTTNAVGLIYQVQVGADFTVFPHLDIRAEYGAGQFVDVSGFGTNDTQTLQQLGLGAVIRF